MHFPLQCRQDLPHFVEVDGARVVQPGGGHDGTKDAVVGVRQCAELVLDEVTESGLRRLEDAEAVELAADAGRLCNTSHAALKPEPPTETFPFNLFNLLLTVPALAYGARAVGHGAHDEGVVVLLALAVDAGPRVLLDVHRGLRHLGIGVEEVAAEQQAEGLGGLNLERGKTTRRGR